MLRMDPALLGALDAWIAEQAENIPPEELSRPEAARRLIADGLIGMGLLKPGA